MSKNLNKDKGKRWENDAADLLNKEFPAVWKRIPLSGALGTQLNLPLFKGDLLGVYNFLPNKILAEAKVGYGGSSMTIEKEWFDKIKAAAGESYSIPLVLLKFEKSRSGVKHIVAMDFETWDFLMKRLESLNREIESLHDHIERSNT